MAKSIIIIGGGPGGYVAAIRAAQLGAQVTLIEKDKLGGTCLNRGCVPTKALLRSAEIMTEIKNAGTFGISAEKVTLDFTAVMKRKEEVVKRLQMGVTFLMKKNKVRVVNGTGTFIDNRTVAVGSEKIKADAIVIATGSKPSGIPVRGVDEPGVITSDDALSLEQLPKSMVIIGGGVIGLEFAQILHRLGCKVTVVEMMPQLLPTEDEEIARVLEGILKKEGIDIYTCATVTGVRTDAQKGKVVSFTTKDGAQEKAGEKVLLAVGRRPCTDGLGADKAGVAMDKGRIIVNEKMETHVPGIYAIGDVTGKIMLAHVAMEEGKVAVENVLGANRKMSYREIPRCIYTSPGVGGVGLTEAEAKKKGNIKIGRFPLIASGKALILNETSGMVKIIADEKYGEILGVHIIGPEATELISEAVLAMSLEATFEEIAATIHAHPTLSESMMEAALAVGGKAIHF